MGVPLEVADDEILHRRVHPTFVKPDGSVSSQAFRDSGMSVDRAKYSTVEETLRGYEDCGLAALLTSFAREVGQEVADDRAPLNLAHALVMGKKTKSIAKRLAQASRWVVSLPQEWA
jgi:hypothetical protein